jgi:hypothetical protein
MRSCNEGVSTVPGQMALQRITLGHKIGGHAFGQTNDGCFRSAVNESIGQTAHARADAGHVDDAATPLFEHFGQDGLNHPKLTARIQIESKVPIFVGGLQNGAAVHHTRAIEQGIDARNEGHLFLNVIFVHDIQHSGVHIGNPSVSLEQLGIDIGCPDCGAFGTMAKTAACPMPCPAAVTRIFLFFNLML